MSMDFPNNPFWDFSITTYGKPGVAPACLTLQERLGIDVNILLFCAWAGSQGAPLTPADIRVLEAAVAEWHSEAVRPLRAVRQRLKRDLDGAEPSDLQLSLRARLQKIEIDAEHIEQLRLYSALDITNRTGIPDSVAIAAKNMKRYLRRADASMDEELLEAVGTIANAAADAAISEEI